MQRCACYPRALGFVLNDFDHCGECEIRNSEHSPEGTLIMSILNHNLHYLLQFASWVASIGSMVLLFRISRHLRDISESLKSKE